VLFLCALSVGAIRPKPGHKKLFEKSFLEFQKLCQSEAVQSVGNSLAYLSYKKGKLGLPPQTPTQRTFGKKSFGIPKTLHK